MTIAADVASLAVILGRTDLRTHAKLVRDANTIVEAVAAGRWDIMRRVSDAYCLPGRAVKGGWQITSSDDPELLFLPRRKPA